ncbi:MAG: CBS domain-containing protein [Xanthobacteraceae bacterium]
MHCGRRHHPGDARPPHVQRHHGNVDQGFGCVGIVDARRDNWWASSPTATCAGISPGPPRPRGRRRHDPRPDLRQADQLASETLQLLNAAKITAVFVIERGKPIGVLHLHDLLRAGSGLRTGSGCVRAVRWDVPAGRGSTSSGSPACGSASPVAPDPRYVDT